MGKPDGVVVARSGEKKWRTRMIVRISLTGPDGCR